MIVETILVILLGVLVAGLLRSHADILRALHNLGSGVGDPAVDGAASASAGLQPGGPRLTIGPPLPRGRDGSSAHDLAGITPSGDALALRVVGTGQFTLLAFLSSGCGTCASIWEALGAPNRHGLPRDVRPVVVTRGPELETPSGVSRLAPGEITVVMSSQAWDDYEVPASPFFALVDGRTDTRVGEGVSNNLSQVADLVRRARLDAEDLSSARGLRAGGPARELRNDQELMSAGIHPGHASLYPNSLEDVFPPRDPRPRPSER